MMTYFGAGLMRASTQHMRAARWIRGSELACGVEAERCEESRRLNHFYIRRRESSIGRDWV